MTQDEAVRKVKKPKPPEVLIGYGMRPAPEESVEELLLRRARERAALELAFEKAEQERERILQTGRANIAVKSGTLPEHFNECKNAPTQPWVIADLAQATKLHERTIRKHLKGDPISSDAKERYEAALTEKLGYRVQVST